VIRATDRLLWAVNAIRESLAEVRTVGLNFNAVSAALSALFYTKVLALVL
jgi:hypothetical protein